MYVFASFETIKNRPKYKYVVTFGAQRCNVVKSERTVVVQKSWKGEEWIVLYITFSYLISLPGYLTVFKISR